MAEPALTKDRFLGGRLRLYQPAQGVRAGSDAVLLAAAVAAKAGERALDVGCGAGPAALCLACRVAGVRVTGLEIQPALAELARRNAALNRLDDRVTIVTGDLTAMQQAQGLAQGPTLSPASFDHVLANPPYFQVGRSNRPPDPARATARLDAAGELGDWARFCLAMARPGGTITMIYRAERLAELERLLAVGAGELTVLALLPRAGRPAKRAIVWATKGSSAPARRLDGLVVHRRDGCYTEAVEAVLRDGAPLPV